MLKASYQNLELLLDIDGQEKIRSVLLRGDAQDNLRLEFSNWKLWLEGKFVGEFLDLEHSILDTFPGSPNAVLLLLTTQIIREYLGIDEALDLKCKTKQTPINCFCYGLDAVEMSKLSMSNATAAQLTQATRAGSSCGSCTGQLKELLSLQYLKSMGTEDQQLSILEQAIFPKGSEKFLCKCFKLSLSDLWKSLESINLGRYPLMGLKCQTCRPSLESATQSSSSPLFYWQGKNLMEWAELFEASAPVIVTEISPGKVSMIGNDKNFNLSALEKNFGPDWKITLSSPALAAADNLSKA
jgi:bacterioferritin-associated ferredoxin